MRRKLSILAAGSLLAILGACCHEARQTGKVTSPPLIIDPGARASQEADSPPEFTVEVVSQEELEHLAGVLGAHEPAGWKRWTIDAIYLGGSRNVLVSDRCRLDDKTGVTLTYGNAFVVRWRERDLFCLDAPLRSGTVRTVFGEEVEAELLALLLANDGFSVIEPPPARDEVPVKYPAPRPVVRRPDDAARDLVARFGWRG